MASLKKSKLKDLIDDAGREVKRAGRGIKKEAAGLGRAVEKEAKDAAREAEEGAKAVGRLAGKVADR